MPGAANPPEIITLPPEAVKVGVSKPVRETQTKALSIPTPKDSGDARIVLQAVADGRTSDTSGVDSSRDQKNTPAYEFTTRLNDLFNQPLTKDTVIHYFTDVYNSPLSDEQVQYIKDGFIDRLIHTHQQENGTNASAIALQKDIVPADEIQNLPQLPSSVEQQTMITEAVETIKAETKLLTSGITEEVKQQAEQIISQLSEKNVKRDKIIFAILAVIFTVQMAGHVVESAEGPKNSR